ncbi:MAG: sigma-54-dependent Fis family transcriptional regulator [Deltaproteobacteria bacterium]|nr:sigma-54-dependent Fis family transcriptional regulator [Deltaproteobacteria bacterium]
MSARILVVDDKPNMRRLLSTVLEELGEVVVAEGGVRAVELLARDRFHVVVSDIKMPDLDGHALLRATRKLERPPQVVLMTAFGTMESAIDALRDGAFDYVTKPFDPDHMKATVQRALAKVGVDARPTTVDPSARSWHGIVGRAPAMLDVVRLVEKVAASDATVLIFGESGTGKELLARAIHDVSARARQPFVAVNCAAIPSSLMEAELFGYAKGAFTGASGQRAGLFEQAHGGTLFLDEIGEMRRAMQAKLTRALEARAVRRIGEAHERPIDVRIVAATHRDLPALIAQGAFREDLWYRLNTCVVRVPALRERPGDLAILVEHFLAQSGHRAGITPEAMAALSAHPFPGNVRELRSALERAAIVAGETTITRDALPQEICAIELPRPEPPSFELAGLTYRDALDRVRADGVRRYLESILERFGGNVSTAAEHADVERESFYRLCRKHGINPADFRKA